MKKKSPSLKAWRRAENLRDAVQLMKFIDYEFGRWTLVRVFSRCEGSHNKSVVDFERPIPGGAWRKQLEFYGSATEWIADVFRIELADLDAAIFEFCSLLSDNRVALEVRSAAYKKQRWFPLGVLRESLSNAS